MKNLSKKAKSCVLTFICALALACSFLFFGTDTAFSSTSVLLDKYFPNTEIESYELSSAIDAYFGDDFVAVIKDSSTLIISKNYKEFETVSYSFTSLKQVKRLNDDYLLVSDDALLKLVKLDDGYPVETLSGESPLTASYFDVAGSTLVRNYGSKGTKYILNGTTVQDSIEFDVNGDKPITVFGDTVYFVKDSTVYKREGGNIPEPITDKILINPDCMITNGEYIYYIKDGIYKISTTDNGYPTLLRSNETMELGNPVSPVSLCFKGDNLVVICQNSIEEYRVDGDKLVFTGFAIAKNKTAYNRISSTAKDIERLNDNLAVLDDDKLTVINTDGCDGYNRENYTNLFIDNAPDYFALGLNSVLTSKNEKLSVTGFDKTTTELSVLPESVKDICYKNGYYFVLTNDGINSHIYKISESTPELNSPETYDGKVFVKFCVLTDGTVYPTDDAEIIKLDSDLSGNIFALKADGILYSLSDDTFTPYSLSVSGIESFSMNFDKKEVFFVNGTETVYKTLNLNNTAITDLSIPSAFTSSSQTLSPDELKTCTVKDGAGIFSVDLSADGVKFVNFSEKENQYVVMEKIDELSVHLLSGDNKTVVVPSLNIENEQSPEFSEINQEMFISTGVHAYFYPVVDRNGTFVLTNAENGIKLNKGDKITAIKKFNYLNIDYYYATVKVEGNDIDCYIPTSFTAENLYKDTEYKNISVDEQETAKNSVRNVLIILACITCACGTTTYFILRKKDI